MMSNIACFLHHASCRGLRTFHCPCWLFSCVSILWCRSRSCLSFCSVCNYFIGPVLLSSSYIWHWYWLHRYIVSSICHEFDNISLMISESIMHSASMVDDALDCILGVPFFHCWTKVMFWSMYCIFQHSIALCVGFLLSLVCFIARMCCSHKEFDYCSFYCLSICLFTVLTIGWLPFLTQHWMVRWLP